MENRFCFFSWPDIFLILPGNIPVRSSSYYPFTFFYVGAPHLSNFHQRCSMADPKKPVPPAIAARVALINAARVALINGQFSLEDDQIAFMGRARTILSEAARQIVESLPDHYDVGRTIAALDMVQNAKDAFCVAAILPQYKPPATTAAPVPM